VMNDSMTLRTRLALRGEIEVVLVEPARPCGRVVIGAGPARTILAPNNTVVERRPTDDPTSCLGDHGS
jgi:hypothetical protein